MEWFDLSSIEATKTHFLSLSQLGYAFFHTLASFFAYM